MAQIHDAARGRAFPKLPPPPVLAAAVFAQSLTLGVLITSLFTFGEEFGWWGFLLVHLVPLGRWCAWLTYGPMLGLWIPAVIVGRVNDAGNGVRGPVMMGALTIAFALNQTALRVRYDSVFLTSFFHASINNQGHGVLPLLVTGVSPILGGITGMTGILAFAAPGAWLLARTPEPRPGEEGHGAA